ncbi:hypothetical protein FGF1_03820 [Flavobacteriaceae bacterium GF1]
MKTGKMKKIQFGITPQNITELLEHEVFVFGSNLAGKHSGGAAKVAQENFGAENGIGEGMTGKSYALPTLTKNLRKRSLKSLQSSVDKLLETVRENTDKQFLITEVGCGIAGFTYEEIAPMFKEFYPLPNVSLPLAFLELIGIKGFKAFNKGMKCRNKMYSENELFEEDVDINPCSSGMHFCPKPLDVLNYYNHGIDTEYAEVVSVGEYREHDDKIVTNKLKVKGKITFAGMLKVHFDWVRDTVRQAVEGANTKTATNDNEHASASGNYGHASASGYKGHASASGYKGHASASGDEGHASASGDEGHASASGYKGHASASGDEGHASASGYKGHASASGYKGHASASGDEGHASASGYKGHASASGDEGHASASGNYGHASASGDEGHASASGNYGHASASGDEGHASASGYKGHASASGDESIACTLGIQSKSKADKGWLIIVDWRMDNDYNYHIHDIHRAKVGLHKINGVLIEPDTWYWFENGVLRSKK